MAQYLFPGIKRKENVDLSLFVMSNVLWRNNFFLDIHNHKSRRNVKIGMLEDCGAPFVT